MIVRDENGRALKARGHYDGDGCVFPSPGHFLHDDDPAPDHTIGDER